MPDRPREIAELYDEWHRPRTLDAGRMPDSPWHRLALRYLGDVAGRRVLEIGCGVGEFTRLLAERGATVTGADISRVAVDQARREVAAFPSATALVADICALPFASASFDLVVSLETIEHSPDPRSALAELVRVTKPGGRLIVSCPNYHGFIGLYRVAMRIVGRRFTEGGQPINKWTTLIGTALRLKRLGCRIQAVDGAVLSLPVPRLGEIDLSWMDRGHFLAKWLARHGIVIATKA
jgi:SAM-dependent methyltransferase